MNELDQSLRHSYSTESTLERASPRAVAEMENTMAEGAWIFCGVVLVVVVMELIEMCSMVIMVFYALSRKV